MRWLFAWRKVLLIIVLISGVLLFPGLQQALKIDNSLRSWFIKGDPALENYYKLQDHFGNDELIILVLFGEESVLEPKSRNQVKQLISALEADSAIAYVLHPFNWELPDLASGGLLSQAFIPPTSMEAEAVIAKNEFLKQQFFAQELRATRLYLKLKNSENFETERAGIIRNIYSITNQHWPKNQKAFGGLGVIYEALNQLSARDFGTFLGLGYLLMFSLISLLYRHWKFTLYAMGSVAFAAYFTIAIYGSFGFRLNLLSTLIPTIIILLGIMDVMHILNEFRKRESSSTQQEAALGALKRIWKPCLFTSISTMAGFLSLMISPVAILAQFGLFSALGIGLALFFSYLLGVFILPQAPSIPTEDKSTKLLGNLQDWVVHHPRPILSFLIVVLIAGAISIPQLKVDTDSIGYLPEDHVVRTDSDTIEALFGPYMPLDYLIESPQQDLNEATLQQELYFLDQDLSALPAIGSMTGYHDLMAALLKGRDVALDENWENDPLLDFELANIEALNPELKAAFLAQDGHLGRFYLSGELISAGQLKATLSEVDSIANVQLGPNIKIKAAGYQSLYAEIVNYITESQVKSFLLAGIMIFLLLWLFLRDLRLSLISLIPNFFPIIVLLSTMVWFDIALDTATASIASIVLSFSIDDTMHFIWHYRKSRHLGQGPAEARKKTMTHVGRAIVFTSLVLFAGYALMWFGNLKTVIYFGTLTASSIIAALLSQLFFFPLLLAKFDT